MRKIIFQNLISIDGFFEGPNKEIDWHNVDGEFNDYAIENLDSIDLLLFGRVTYQLMASYWPTEQSITDDPIVAGKMNSFPKIVFSRTLEKAEWENTRIIKENIAEEVSNLKNQPGKNIAIFGSSDLSLTLIKHNLIDEFHIIVNPVLLGGGKTLFEGINERINFRLIESKVFKSGNVLLKYQTKR